MLYPVAATQYNNVKQQEFAQQYNNDVLEIPAADLSGDLARARAYNATLTGVPILDPWLLQVAQDPGSKPYREYMSQLALFDVMARIRVPSAQIDLPVRHGTFDDAIAIGAGHLYGTSLPVGGEGTHAVLTSHTGMPNATLFDHLTSVREGDLMFVDVDGETLAYQVDRIKVVLPNEIDDLKAEPGQDLLTLFTCTPYAINTHRLLVRGHRVPFDPATSPAAPQPGIKLTLEPWMIGLIAGAVLGLAMLLFLVGRERRRAARRGRRQALGPRRRARAQQGPARRAVEGGAAASVTNPSERTGPT